MIRKTKFTTSDKDHVGDDYFLTSGDKMQASNFCRPYAYLTSLAAFRRYFLEPDAVNEDGKLTREKEKAVNKIGHGM